MEDMVTITMENEMPSERKCRSCASKELKPVLDLGKTPLADGLLKKEDIGKPERLFPLEAVFCDSCCLMQILETVPPKTLFCDDYPYFSSFSEELLTHSRENALELISALALGPGSFVVEIASNDGYLLKNFVEKGIECLGIDPAEGPAKAAEKAGVKTLNAFFTEETARELAGKGKKADLIIGNNVLAHVPDHDDFLGGVRALLKESGVAVFEVPYVRDLIEKCEFDTIYHEHLCYFSMTSLDTLFRRRSLYLKSVKRIKIHGGSLRVTVALRDEPDGTVKKLLAQETAGGVNNFGYYGEFSFRVGVLKNIVLSNLWSLREAGKRIAAYGAAAKGSTLVNYFGIGTDLIDFVADRNVHKQDKYMPGKHIPIYGPERILQEMPDYVLVLAWNFAEEIIGQQNEYVKRGGRFIVPVPSWKII